MPYIGNPIYQSAFVTDQFSGTGSQTAYTMSVAPAGTTNVLVVVSGVVQDPSTYGVVGNTLTFSTAPPSGTGNISCRYLGVPVTGITTTAYRTVTEFTATASQTTFTPPSYNVGFINVYLNGVLLGSADYTATNGTTVVLATGASAGNILTVESFQISSVANAIQNSSGSVSSSNIVAGAVTPAKLSTGGPYWDTSSNFGINTTSPAYKLDVNSTTSRIAKGSTTNTYALVSNTSGDLYMGVEGATAGTLFNGTTAYASAIGCGPANSFQIATNNTVRMTIDSSGRATNPYQPSFVAGLTASQSLPLNTWTTLIPNYTSRNQGSAYNTSTGVFTAPIAGMYMFTLVTLFYPTASGTNLDLRYLINGNTPTYLSYYQGTAPPGNHCNRDDAFLVYLSANDTFTMQAYANSSGVQFYGSQTAYSGMLIS